MKALAATSYLMYGMIKALMQVWFVARQSFLQFLETSQTRNCFSKNDQLARCGKAQRYAGVGLMVVKLVTIDSVLEQVLRR